VNGLTGTKHNTHIDPANTRINTRMIAIHPGQQERDVALSFKFNADSSRVFYALSIPEYIEAWLQAPDTDDLRFVFNQIEEETFRLDLYRKPFRQASMPPAGSSAPIRSDISGEQPLPTTPQKPSST